MFPFQKEKKIVIRFHFDGNQASWKDIKIIEKLTNGTPVSQEDLQLLAAHFMVDEKGAYLPEDKAVRILDGLKQAEIMETMTQFTDAIQEALIPKASGNVSSLPSNPGQAEPFPNGPAS
jgi:hypothetical protein